jgi:hypothetical protein
MTVSPNDILRVALRFSDANGSDVMNVYHFTAAFAAGQSDTDVKNALDAGLSAAYEGIEAVLDDSLSPIDMKVDVITWGETGWVTESAIYDGPWGASIDNVAVGDPLVPGAAGLLTLHTPVVKLVGRKFIGGFVDTIKDALGNMTSAFQATFLAAFEILLDGIEVAASNSLIYIITSTIDGSFNVVDQMSVSPFFAYQRRRRPGVGS